MEKQINKTYAVSNDNIQKGDLVIVNKNNYGDFTITKARITSNKTPILKRLYHRVFGTALTMLSD